MSFKEIVERKPNEKRVVTVEPLVNIHEEADQVVLQAEMPGLTKDNIAIEVQADELVLSGTRLNEVPKGYNIVVQERPSIEYKRIFSLGHQIDKNMMNANYENGILTVILKKTAAAQPRKIAIT